jgi:8-oxo-dGTP diphosphatase
VREGVPKKRSVALAAWGEEGLLLVLRPPEDPEFGGAWGLPAVSLEGEETLEEACHRVAREKLGTALAEARPLAFGVEERPRYTLELWVFEGRLLAPPKLPAPKPGKTYYAAFRYGHPEDLREAAKRGSLCSRLYLAVKGLCP